MDNNLDRSTFDTGSNTAHKAQFKTPEPAPPTTPESSQSPASGASASTPTGGQTNAEENKGTAGKKGRRFGGYGMGPVTREVAGYMQRNGSKLRVQNQLIVARLALGIIQLLSFLASQFCVLRGVLTTQLLTLQLLTSVPFVHFQIGQTLVRLILSPLVTMITLFVFVPDLTSCVSGAHFPFLTIIGSE